MNRVSRKGSWIAAMALAAVIGTAGTTSIGQGMGSQEIVLSGSNEIPAVTTTASGKGTVTINADRSVTAMITVKDMTATAAHIHEAAAGANVPVIVPFTKKGDDSFVAADGAKLTEAQYASYKAGNLYVNVHSA